MINPKEMTIRDEDIGEREETEIDIKKTISIGTSESSLHTS
jgi:hypothetical protein